MGIREPVTDTWGLIYLCRQSFRDPVQLRLSERTYDSLREADLSGASLFCARADSSFRAGVRAHAYGSCLLRRWLRSPCIRASPFGSPMPRRREFAGAPPERALCFGWLISPNS